MSWNSNSPDLYQTYAVWAKLNPNINSNQKAYESNTGKYKVGTGQTTYLALPYAGTNISAVTSQPGAATTAVMEKLDSIEPGADVTDLGNVTAAISGATVKTNMLTTDSIVVYDGALKTLPYSATLPLIQLVTTQVDITASTTLTDITGVTLLTGKTYIIDCLLFVLNTANTGFKCAFTKSGGLAEDFFRVVAGTNSTAGAVVQYTDSNVLTDTLCANAGKIDTVHIKGVVTALTGGILRITAAQNTSHADTLSILPGSYLWLHLKM
jgi:hypothetical protein